MEVEKWVEYTIEVHPNEPDGQPDYHTRIFLHRINFRRDLLDKYRWYTRYLHALYQVRYPRQQVDAYWVFYDKKTGLDLLSMPLVKLSSAKRMITKIQNAIKALREESKGNLFADNYTKDPVYIRLLEKLDIWTEREKELQEEVEKLKLKESN